MYTIGWMSIQDKIDNLQRHFWCQLPAFYVDFLTLAYLQESRTFVQELTLLYGIDDLANHQSVNQIYLPNFIRIGDNGGTHSFFIDGKNQTDIAIYICANGDLDLTSLEKLADNFSDWAKKDFDSEIFLDKTNLNAAKSTRHC